MLRIREAVIAEYDKLPDIFGVRFLLNYCSHHIRDIGKILSGREKIDKADLRNVLE